MSEQQGGQQSPQDRYYQRYLADTEPNAFGGGKRSRTPLIVAGAAALVVAVGVVGAFALRGGGTVDGSATESTAASTVGGSPSGSSNSTTSSPTTTPTSVVNARRYGDPSQAGWITVPGSDKAKAAYDIPATDKYAPGKVDRLIGYEPPEGVDHKWVIASSASSYDRNFCKTDKGGQRAFMGFVNIGTREPAEAAPGVASETADLIAYKKDKKTMASRTPTKTTTIKVNGGRTTAVQSVLTVDNGDPSTKKCDPKKLEVRTVAFTNSGNGVSTMLLVVRDLGAGQMPDADVTKIVASVRPKIAD